MRSNEFIKEESYQIANESTDPLNATVYEVTEVSNIKNQPAECIEELGDLETK
jgi:hypothetical protein